MAMTPRPISSKGAAVCSREVERGGMQGVSQAQGGGRDPQRGLVRQRACGQPEIEHDGDGGQGVVFDIAEEELHRAQAEQESGHEQALAAAAARFPGQLQHHKDVDRAGRNTGDGVGGEGIGPLPKALAERPQLRVPEDGQGRLPGVDQAQGRIGIGDGVGEDVGVAPARVNQAQGPEEGHGEQGQGDEPAGGGGCRWRSFREWSTNFLYFACAFMSREVSSNTANPPAS